MIAWENLTLLRGKSRLINASAVPAASKAFSPPWAESKQQSRWSSEYHDCFAFGEQWFQHMRRATADKENPDTAGFAHELTSTVDSLLLPWDHQASNRPLHQQRDASNVLEFGQDDDAEEVAVDFDPYGGGGGAACMRALPRNVRQSVHPHAPRYHEGGSIEPRSIVPRLALRLD